MKKGLFVVAVTGIVLSLATLTYAEGIKFSVEPYMEQVLKRDVSQDEFSGRITQGWYGAKASATVFDALTLSPFIAGVGTGGKLGGEKLDIDSSFGYGFEAKLDLPKFGLPLDLALIGMIRSTRADINKLGDYEITGDKTLTYIDNSVELQASKTFGKITPFIGPRYSNTRITGTVGDTGNTSKVKLNADDNIGLSVGAKYDITKKFGVSLKAKLIDQTAIELAGCLQF